MFSGVCFHSAIWSLRQGLVGLLEHSGTDLRTSILTQKPGSCSYAVRMCAARFSGCINGCAEEAAGGGGGAVVSCPVTASRMLEWAETSPRILHSLEMGTVMTIFYQKKSQRPERRTFQIKQDMRQIVWSRHPDKIEGESEYYYGNIISLLNGPTWHGPMGPLA